MHDQRHPDAVPSSRDVLTETEAVARASLLGDVSYRISLDLDPENGYSGRVTVRFEMRREGEDTFLDFTGGRIETLSVNGRDVEPPEEGAFRLPLPAALLARENEVHVRYRNAYDRAGAGFHRFVDPEDGETYLYTDFEPFNAHRLFPCFDQPDLKATYELDVTAPEGWKVVANGACTGVEPAGRGRTQRRFAALPRFSTYLFAVVAGPYEEIRRNDGTRDLGLFCRRALRPHLDPDEIFEITEAGFRFYEELFACPYPFGGKYDQLFVPEFNSGAMENVAAVTFNEAYVFRDPPTATQRLTRAEVILHELAHMWFGNLVTLTWWNDLWLNESFATYISFLAIDEATAFESCWENFLGSIKGWALRQDEKPTTHPIAGPVADTDQTFLNFDGITYGKGAASLKQLRALVGPTAFRQGLRLYFERHAWGNTTLKDFLAPIDSATDRDVLAWSRLWLETSGVNAIRPQIEARGDRIERVTLQQSPGNGDGILRPQLLHVGLLRPQGGGDFETDELTEVLVEGDVTEISDFAGRPLPAMLWANVGDHGYAHFVLDDASLAFVRSDLPRVVDPLIRQGIWQTLWTMVREALLSPFAYLELVAEALPQERRPDVVDTVMRSALVTLFRYTAPDRTARLGHRLLAAAEAAARDLADHSDLGLLWTRGAIGCIADRDQAERLLGWLDGGSSTGAAVDQGMRWRILIRASSFGCPRAADLVAEEASKDGSDRGVKSALAARVAAPEPAAKRAALEEFASPEHHSPDVLKHAMAAFWWPHQADLASDLAFRYLELLPAVMATQDLEYASRGFARLLFPHAVADERVLDAAQALRDRTGAEQAVLRRVLVEECDEMERVVRLRSLPD